MPWADDHGEDAEPFAEVHNLRFRHYAPTPQAVRDIFLKYSTTIPDGAFACCLKLLPAKTFEIKFFIYDLLRQDSGLRAPQDITAFVSTGEGKKTELKVICKKDEMQKYFHLTTGKDTGATFRTLFTRTAIKYPELFREPVTTAELDRDEKLDKFGRYDMAPYFYRRILLQLMFNSCSASMKKHPVLREKATQTQRPLKMEWGPKGPHQDRLAALQTPQKRHASKRNLKAAFLKNRYVEVEDTTKPQRDLFQYRLEDLLFADEGTGLVNGDLDPEKLRLDVLWEKLDEESKSIDEDGHHLRWAYNGFDYYVTTQARFVKVAQEMRRLWKGSQDAIKDHFKLFYERGMILTVV